MCSYNPLCKIIRPPPFVVSFTVPPAMPRAGSWLEVRSMSSRIVFITIFMSTLLVYAHYTSALVALLTVTSTSVGFSSLQELLADGSFRLGFLAGTLLEQEFKVGVWA